MQYWGMTLKALIIFCFVLFCFVLFCIFFYFYFDDNLYLVTLAFNDIVKASDVAGDPTCIAEFHVSEALQTADL